MIRRLQELLQFLYPRQYREEYGAEMSRLFADRCRREGALRVSYETFPDLLVTAGKEHMDALSRDLRHTFRSIRRAPGFAAVVIFTLALVIGANTAVFGVVKGVLLDPLPFSDPEQIVQLYEKRPKQGRVRNVVSAPDYADWKQQHGVFQDMAAMTGAAFSLPTAEGTQIIQGARVTSNFFHLLGVKPNLGRGFLPDEQTPAKNRVLILTYGIWVRQFGGDTAILGRKITLGDEAFEVIGVLPDLANAIAPQAEIWQPLTINPESSRGAHFLNVYARLRPDTTLTQAQAAMNVVAARLETQYPDDNTGHGVNIFSLQEEMTGKVRSALLVLFGAVTLVLLVACANLANLFLARTAQRHREIAIRTALGAGSGRLVRQIFTEGIVLGLLGGAAGLGLAYLSVKVLKATNPGNLPRLSSIHIDQGVLLFTIAVSLLTALLFGLLPAILASQTGIAGVLKQGGRNATGRVAMKKTLVIAEVALALILITGSGLMLRSFMRLSAVNPGFDASNVLTLEMPLMATRYADPRQRLAFLDDFLTRAGRLPGVTSVAAVNALPLSGRDSGSNFSIEGRPPLGYSQLPNGRFRVVTPAYLETLRVPLRAGRFFSIRDTGKAQPVLVINETMARQYWPAEDPVGKRISLAGEATIRREIVGVIADVKHYALDGETRPEMYFPYAQQPESTMTAVLRTVTAPHGMIAAVRAELNSMDRLQPVAKIRALEDVLALSLAQPGFYSALLAIFSAVALLLAAVGIYGVMSFATAQRTHEMGIRMALGAKPGVVQALVMKEGLRLAAGGVLIGIVGSLALSGLLRKLLFNTDPTDPLTFLAAPALLFMVATIACYLPARGATRVDPIVALRSE